MRIAVAERANANSLRKRAKPSTTKLPPKVTSLPAGSATTMRPAMIRTRIAVPSMPPTARSPRNAPTMSSNMAPTISTISGSAGTNAGSSTVSVIGERFRSRREQGGGLHRAERVIVVVEELRDRRCRELEHRLGEDPEQDGQRDQRAERDHLAVVEILDGGKAGLGQRAENDLAVEPERIGRRQDGADGRQRRHPGVDPERADQSQKFADEARGAG